MIVPHPLHPVSGFLLFDHIFFLVTTLSNEIVEINAGKDDHFDSIIERLCFTAVLDMCIVP